MFGQAPLSLLVQKFDWRIALEIIGGLGVMLSLIYVLTVRDKQPEKPHTDIPVTNTKTTSGFANLWRILKSKQAWLLSLYSGLAFAPVSVFGGLWGVPFLQQAHQLSPSQAAWAISWIFIGFAVGAPLLGWMSDWVGRRKPIMTFGTLLALVTLITVIYGSNKSLILLSTLLFCFGFGASGFFTSFAMIREVFPILLAATVLGFMNTFDSICEALSEPLVGFALDSTWNGAVVQGVHQFSTHGYQLALSILPIYLVISTVLLLFIQETHCQTYESNA